MNVETDDRLHGSGSSVSSVVSQTSSTMSSSVVSSRSGIIDQSDGGTFHSLSRLQEICQYPINMYRLFCYCYLHCHLISGEGIVTFGVRVCVCVSVCAKLRLHAALVSAVKVMH